MGVRVKRGSRSDRNREALAAVEREGQEAFRRGVPFEANPYPDGGGLSYSGRFAYWCSGWRRAEWQRDRPAYEAARCGR